MSRTKSALATALDQINFARRYSLRLIDIIDPAEWFKMPPGSGSNIAWQVGHLAMAEYRLALERVRGARPEDAELIPEEFLKLFGRESTAQETYPYTAQQIRTVFDRVHSQFLREAPTWPDDDRWDEPPFKPHPFASTKLACLFMCSQHEMLHAGQMGLVRRQLGHKHIF